MSILAKKLLEAADKSDGFKAWALAPIAAEHIQELESQRDDLLDVLELALRAHGAMLLSDPPQDPWVSWAVEQKARAAIAKVKGER